MIHIWRLLDVGGRVGVSECSGRPIFIFLIERIGFGSWPEIMLIIYYWQEIFLWTLTSDSETILWWYHCIHHSNKRWDCCSIVYLRFQDVEIKQVYCKISTIKMSIFINRRSFPDIFGQVHTQGYKATKKQIVKLQLNLDLMTYHSHP